MTEQPAQQRQPRQNPAIEKKQRQARNQLSSVQITFAAILALGLILAINFSSRIAAGQPLQEAYNRVVAEIDTLTQEQATLIAERDYAATDAYVENWARNEGKMIRPGEVLIVPVPSGTTIQEETVSQPQVAVDTTPPEPEPWTLWWSLFFDSPPPES